MHTHTHTQAREFVGALILFLAFASCSKEESAGPVAVQEVDVTARVKAFIEQASHGADRSSNYTLDSSAWYLEAALNFSCTTPWMVGEDQMVDSINMALPLVNGEVSMESLAQAYEALSHQLCSSASGRSLQVVDVVPEPGVDSLRMLIASHSVLGGDRGWGEVGVPKHLVWGDWTGTITNCGCGPDAGASSVCADKKIQARLNWSVGPIPVGTYYTNVQAIDAGSASVYSCIGPANNCTCLSPATIDDRTNYGWMLFGLLQPQGKSKVNAFMYSAQTLGGDDAMYYTGAIFKYGIQHTGNPNQ